ncbi:MAG: hypothetical protein WBD20_17990 [Pirellulaceae bacterium]
MLWPAVLPFQITVCVIAAIVCSVTIVAPMVRWKRLPTFFASLLLGALLFIPSCIGVMNVIDQRRFGVFQHANFPEVDDFRVERYLPPAATNITIDKQAQGFRAKFSLTRKQLDTFMKDVWDAHGDADVSPAEETAEPRTVDAGFQQMKYGDLGWPHLPDAIEFGGPYASNGAGFSIYYSPSQQVAYQHAGYW